MNHGRNLDYFSTVHARFLDTTKYRVITMSRGGGTQSRGILVPDDRALVWCGLRGGAQRQENREE